MSTGKGQEQTGHSKTPTEADAVCNQFFFEDRKSPTMHELREAPSGTFTLLVPEATTKQLRALLKKEYDVSNIFSNKIWWLESVSVQCYCPPLVSFVMKPDVLIKSCVNADQSYDFARLATIAQEWSAAQTVHREWAITLEVVLKYVLT
jgi:hypothetical protein